MRQIEFIAHQKASVVEIPADTAPLTLGCIRGRTVVSLISPGTEINSGFLAREGFPHRPGYACVFEVRETAADVTDLQQGTLVLASGHHGEEQVAKRDRVVPLPKGLQPEAAVFARLAAVSMSTLTTTTARPPGRVLVTGLGPVGNLAAQIFSSCGYRVTAVDPIKERREMAYAHGLKDVRDSITEDAEDIVGKVALHLECSGHEKAVVDGAKAVAHRGEVVLVGVPWQKRSDTSAFELLHAIFHRYAVVRSGWEWEVPYDPTSFRTGSLTENYEAALQWIASGRIKVDGMAGSYAPDQAQRVYSGLLDRSLPTPAALFSWKKD